MNSIGHYLKKELMVELEGTDKKNALRQVMNTIEGEKLLPDPEGFF